MSANVLNPSAERARWAVSLVFMINGLLYATWAVSIPGLRDRLHLTPAQIGAALLCIGIGSLLSMTATGGWAARWGSHRLTRWSAVLAMLSLMPPFLMPSLWSLGIALTLLGALNGMLDVSMNAQGVTIEKALGRPIMSRLHAYFSLGGVIGAGLGTLLIGRLSMLAHIGLITVLLTLAALVAGTFLIPDPAHPQGTSSADTAGENPLRFSPAVLLLGGLCFLGMLSEGANYDWAALYFRDVLHMAGGKAGMGYTAFVTTMTLGRWLGDGLRVRFGDELLVRGGSMLTALGLGLALVVQQPSVALLGFALSGLGLSNVVPVMYGTAGHALAGKGIAQVATLGYLGFLLGPPTIGFVAERSGLPAALTLALAGVVLIALLGQKAFQLVRHHQGT